MGCSTSPRWQIWIILHTQESIHADATSVSVRVDGETWIPRIWPKTKNESSGQSPPFEEQGFPHFSVLEFDDVLEQAESRVEIYFQAEGDMHRTELTFTLAKPLLARTRAPSSADGPNGPPDPSEFNWSIKWKPGASELTIDNHSDRKLKWDWIKIDYLDKDGWRLENHGASCDEVHHWEPCAPYEVPANSSVTFHGNTGDLPYHTRNAIKGVQVESDPGGVWESD